MDDIMANIPKLNKSMYQQALRTLQGIFTKPEIQEIVNPYQESLNLYQPKAMEGLSSIRLSPEYRANKSFADYDPTNASIVIDPWVAKGRGASPLVKMRGQLGGLDDIEMANQHQAPLTVMQHETNHHSQTMTGLDQLFDRPSQEYLANQHASVAGARALGMPKKEILDRYMSQYGPKDPRIDHVKASLSALRSAILLPALLGDN